MHLLLCLHCPMLLHLPMLQQFSLGSLPCNLLSFSAQCPPLFGVGGWARFDGEGCGSATVTAASAIAACASLCAAWLTWLEWASVRIEWLRWLGQLVAWQ
mmetsp:Transcript_48677/g.80882  ORF Transcript_48677/g.80882 Transcript_48677/m.80882 type:complete len:100 (-) Transcript_48677:1844-2143(-)